jgi:hypothetical protein
MSGTEPPRGIEPFFLPWRKLLRQEEFFRS